MATISLTSFPIEVELENGTIVKVNNFTLSPRKSIQQNYITNNSVGFFQSYDDNSYVERGTITYQMSSDINLDSSPPVVGISSTSIFDQDPLITLETFYDRPYSTYTVSSLRDSFGIPSINLSGAKFSSFPTPSVLQVQGSSNPLQKFPTSGKVQLNNDVITYTGKTNTTLTGIVRSNPTATHQVGDYLRTISV